MTFEDGEFAARPIGERTFEITQRRPDPRALRLPARGLRPLRQPPRRAHCAEAAIAAGHPATADAGAEILAEGGTAADAVVAAALASCVAETLMTGLLGGGHAITFDAASGSVRNLDCFVSVPSGAGAPMAHLRVAFGEQLVDYAIGASSWPCRACRPGWTRCGAPGAHCRGRGSSSRRFGSRGPASRCRRPTSRASRCSSP